MVRLLSVQKAAVLLDVHEDTVRRLIGRGELAAARIGRVVRVDYTDLESLIARRRIGKAPERTDDQITAGQLAAFHAKCNELDRISELDRGTTKQEMLGRAARQFERELGSVDELSRREASRVLDGLECEIDATRRQRIC